MPLIPQGNFTFLHANQADTPNVAASVLKGQWDTQGNELKTTVNNLIIALEKTTLTSGAEQIGSLAIADLTGTTIHAQLLSLRNQLKSIVDGFSGADFIAATAIAGLTGGTVQALLEALKSYADLKDTAQTTALTTHKTSSDHDGRYFTETELQSIVDANSGADKVGATAITDVIGTTVQAILESLRNTLKSIVDASSGADFVNSTAITGVTGTTVQSQLESIKLLIDAIYTKAQLDAGQLDNRYFTETELQSTTSGTSGAAKIGATQVAVGSGTQVQAILEWLYLQITNVTLGQIVDGSLTNAKLATDIKVGSLATLTTTDKSSVVAAVNEVFTLKAPLVSPALTGTPTAPTAAANTNTTQLATTEFVTTADNLKATKATQISNTLLTTTVQTTIATFTPVAQGNFLVGIYFRVVTGTTNVTIVVTYNDNTGAQTNTMINAQVSAVGSYSLVPLFINAVSGTAITVKVTASVANQVYASASVVGV